MSLHYNGANSYLVVNGTEIIKFKAKDSEIVATPLCLWNISNDFSVDNVKRAGLNGCVSDFSVDYYAMAVDDILHILKYLMKQKNMMEKYFYLLKKLCLVANDIFFDCNLLNVNPLHVREFNIMLRTNETRHIKWHETFKCKCRLDESVCNNKQRWNNDKCRCKCK